MRFFKPNFLLEGIELSPLGSRKATASQPVMTKYLKESTRKQTKSTLCLTLAT